MRRFSANASKSKQATSAPEAAPEADPGGNQAQLAASYPYIAFKPEREAGNQLLTVEGLSATVDGQTGVPERERLPSIKRTR